jgi:hypothetical protein
VEPAAVAEAVDEIGRMLRADGADLLLVDADPRTARVHVRLELAGAQCAECVLPPDELARTIEISVRRRVPEEFELLVDDPRR